MLGLLEVELGSPLVEVQGLAEKVVVDFSVCDDVDVEVGRRFGFWSRSCH